ncbi:hypothetical protein [Nostoc sp.]|uniref:hypothetical protein n=1 Tax=Nostoc sp. TaxID=1180 RepID=UPI002FF78205
MVARDRLAIASRIITTPPLIQFFHAARVVILRIGRSGLTGNYVADDGGVAASPLQRLRIAQQGILRYGYNGFWLVITIDFGIVHQLA